MKKGDHHILKKEFKTGFREKTSVGFSACNSIRRSVLNE